MSRSGPLCPCLALWACLAGQAGATGLLTEEGYLAAVARDSSAAVLLEGGVNLAEAELRRARVLSNPILSAERESPGGGRSQFGWSVSWTAPFDGRRGLRVDAAEAGLASARELRERDRAQLRAELRERYAAWAVAAERESVAAQHAGGLSRLVALARDRARLGEDSGLTARRVALAALEAEGLAATARAELAESRAAALGWSGDPGGDIAPCLPLLPVPAPVPGTEHHPALAALRHELRESEARRRLGSRFLEFPRVTAGRLEVREPGFDSGGMAFGGEWSLPLFDRSQGDRIEAGSRVRVARARLERERRRIEADAQGTANAYAILRAAALAAADSLREADRVLEAASARFQAAESGVSDLLETVRSVMSARLSAIDLYDRALAAHRRLELLTTAAPGSLGGGAE